MYLIVSEPLVVKFCKDGGPDGRGVDFYFRNVTEIVLFGVRGNMRTLEAGRTQTNLIASRKREHSRKPDELYNIIEACSPGPYIELFARHPRKGWTQWGNEDVEDRSSYPIPNQAKSLQAVMFEKPKRKYG